MAFRIGLFTALTALWLSVGSFLSAQEPQPNIVMAVAPTENLLADVGYVAQLVGKADVAASLKGMVGVYLTGVDRKRPAGACLFVDEADVTSFKAIAFVPVTSFKAHLAVVETQFEEAVDEGDGVFRLKPRGELADAEQAVYVKEHNGWAFYGSAPEHLTTLPADPTVYLGDLTKRYDLAYRFSFENISPEQRREIIEMLRKQMEEELAGKLALGGEMETSPEAMQLVMDVFASYIDGVKLLDLGLSIDQDNKSLSLSYSLDAVPGSKLDKSFAAARNLTSQHGSALVRGALYLNQRSAKLSPEGITFWDTAFKQLLMEMEKTATEANAEKADSSPLKELSKEDRAAVIAWVERAVKATYADGIVDWSGSTIEVAGGLCNLSVGTVANAPALFAEARATLEKRKDQLADTVTIQWDAGKHQGVQIVKVTPKKGKEALANPLTEFYGDKGDIYLGIDANAVFYVTGADAENQLRAMIDRSRDGASIKSMPFRARIDVAGIAKFMTAQAKERTPAIDALLAKLSDSSRKYAIQVQLTSAERATNNLEGRLSIDDGILAIGPELAPVVMELVEKIRAEAEKAEADTF